jgi:hypothetical protein
MLCVCSARLPSTARMDHAGTVQLPGDRRAIRRQRWHGPQAPRQLLFIMVNNRLTRWRNRRFS